MDEKVKAALAALCGAMAALLENYGVILLLCCAFIFIDLATGLTKAKIQGKVNSSTGCKGFWPKAAMLAALMFAICLDVLFDYVAGLGIITVSFSSPVGRILALYIAVNECISILENLIACGIRLPKFISSALAAVHENLDNNMKR